MTDGLPRRAFLVGVIAAMAAACRRSPEATSDDRTSDTGPATSTAAPGTASATTETTTSATSSSVNEVVAAPESNLPATPFMLGVASGDPDEVSVLCWTRLLVDAGAVNGGIDEEISQVALDVASDRDFEKIVSSALVNVDVERGHSVHAVAGGLEPATRYYYRFRLGAFTSPVGQTKTVPPLDSNSSVILALASCQRYGDGYFAAHGDLAAQEDLDAVIFVGDYIYESETNARVRDQPRDIYGMAEMASTLEGYRARYVSSRLDKQLAAAHQAHPWIVTWDDHEVVNDFAGAAPENDRHQVNVERRAAAYQAWWEHQPVRLPPPEGPSLDIYRRLSYGSLVELFMLDCRQYRSAPPCGGGLIDRDCAGNDDDDRTMLGASQEAWLADALQKRPATWHLLGQSVMVSRLDLIGQRNADAWDGYGAARQRLLTNLQTVSNPVVLTGDVHVQIVADVAATEDDDAPLVATELVTASVSSLVPDRLDLAVGALPIVSSAVHHARSAHGWLRIEVTAEALTATYREVVDVTDPGSAISEGKTFVITNGVVGAVAQ